MIDMPTEPPAVYQVVTGVTGVTLPRDGEASPIIVLPLDKQGAQVFDPDGKLIRALQQGDKAKFEFKRPKWWQFWKSPGWEITAPPA